MADYVKVARITGRCSNRSAVAFRILALPGCGKMGREIGWKGSLVRVSNKGELKRRENVPETATRQPRDKRRIA